MWQYNYTPSSDEFYHYNYTNYDNELYHYGVPGMKWGRRKQPAQTIAGPRTNRYATRAGNIASAKAQVKSSSGMIKKVRKTELKAAKAKSDRKEMKVYAKAMAKKGIAGSKKDYKNKGESTALYNDLAKKKGKDYANKVEKKAKRRRAVKTGAKVAGAVLAARFIRGAINGARGG